MKAGFDIIRNFAKLMLLQLCLFVVNDAVAQDLMDITGRIKVVNKLGDGDKTKVDTIRTAVYYGVFSDKGKALAVYNSLSKEDNLMGTQEEFRDKCRANGLRETKGNGTFKTKAYPGSVILAVTKSGTFIEKDENRYTVITSGKSYYEQEIVTHDIIGAGVTGKKRVMKGTPFMTGDGTVTFPINFTIPKDKVKKSTRIVVQPYALDCLNEDTMSYLLPIVYEGDFYHALQDKRMAFDYFKNDVLAPSYRASLINEFQDINPETDKKSKLSRNYLELDEHREKIGISRDSVILSVNNLELDSVSNEVVVDASIKYILPDRNRMCRGAFVCALEDYHSVYYTASYPGTCLVNRPFKFLDFTAGIPQMELTTDFQEEAEENFQKVNERLNLRFKVGSAELVEDSINTLESQKMAKILGDTEGLISQSVKIIASASPDGGEKINAGVAQKRAIAAKHLVSRYLRNVSPMTETKVYTWSDVADRLTGAGKRTEAQTVQDLIAANGSNRIALEKALRQLDFYEPVIVPVLEDMRAMSYSYMFEKKHIMNAEEVVASYYTNKQSYISGTNKLSGGDFYNLFDNITDSLELDTITRIAYDHLVKKERSDLSKLYSERIAPYVLNRMSRLLSDNGTPDTTLLMPFIDEPASDTIFDKELGRKRQMLDVPDVCINHQDILITQALNFYQLQMFPRAHKYIEWIRAMSRKGIPAALNKLQMYMDLMMYYHTDEENPRFVAARNYVLNSSPDNKAILYAEIPEWQISFEDTNDLLDMMDDGNPKKWYLKAVLWSTKADAIDGEPDLGRYEPQDDGFHLLSAEEEEKLIIENYAKYVEYEQQKKVYLESHTDTPVEEEELADISGIKHYLAYFHHCFQLGGSSFRRLYFSEGRINEDMRKKYKYLKKDFPAYERLFTLLKARDDENRASLLEEAEEDTFNTLPQNPEASTAGENTEASTEEENAGTDAETPVTENKNEETKE